MCSLHPLYAVEVITHTLASADHAGATYVRNFEQEEAPTSRPTVCLPDWSQVFSNITNPKAWKHGTGLGARRRATQVTRA